MAAYSECSLGIDSCSDSEGRATPMPDDDRLTPTPGPISSPIYDPRASHRGLGLVSRQTNFGDSVAPSRAYGSTYVQTPLLHESRSRPSPAASRSSSRANSHRPNPSTRVSKINSKLFSFNFSIPSLIEVTSSAYFIIFYLGSCWRRTYSRGHLYQSKGHFSRSWSCCLEY